MKVNIYKVENLTITLEAKITVELSSNYKIKSRIMKYLVNSYTNLPMLGMVSLFNELRYEKRNLYSDESDYYYSADADWEYMLFTSSMEREEMAFFCIDSMLKPGKEQDKDDYVYSMVNNRFAHFINAYLHTYQDEFENEIWIDLSKEILNDIPSIEKKNMLLLNLIWELYQD